MNDRTADAVERVVILGGGLAGASAVDELRTGGYAGELVLVGAEPHPPYERPPLSKDVLLGTKSTADAAVHPSEWYAERDVELVLGTPATGIDLAGRTVAVGDRTLPFDRLLLATGARPRRFALADGSGAVVYLRTVEDAEALRHRLAGRLLIVGGGWIGLEVAAAARAAEGTVTVVEAAAHPLGAVLGSDVARVFADLHRSHGVDLRVNTTVAAIRPDGDATRVRLSDESELDVDTIVVGIGAEPDTGLAEAAGLAVDHGVLVDARLGTSDPHVFAAGDVARHDHPDLGRIRVEHWDNAIEQGRHAARSMLGDPTAYDRQPYFFTDQYDLGMEYVGHTGHGFDEVRVDGDLASRVFTAWWVREGTVVAGMHAGQWDAIDEIRRRVGGPAGDLSGG